MILFLLLAFATRRKLMQAVMFGKRHAPFMGKKGDAAPPHSAELADDLCSRKQSADRLLKELSFQIAHVCMDDEGVRRTVTQLQQAVAALGEKALDLKTGSDAFVSERERLAEANALLSTEIASLRAEADRARADEQRAKDELERLRGEAKGAIEDFVNGSIDKELLKSKLNDLGVQLSIVEGAHTVPLDVNDDSWILQLRSAAEPESLARRLMFGLSGSTAAAAASLGHDDSSSQASLPAVHAKANSSVLRAERALLASQQHLHSAAPALPAAAEHILNKENNGASSIKTAKSYKQAASIGHGSEGGVAFKLSNGNAHGKRNASKLDLSHQSSLQWKENPIFYSGSQSGKSQGLETQSLMLSMKSDATDIGDTSTSCKALITK